MLPTLASGLVTRSASRRLARVIPNRLLRVIVVAAAGYAVERIVERQLARRSVRSTA